MTRVIVVGGGPVGLGLALELGRREVDCVVLERHHSIQPIPKGQNLTQRTMEHFRAWGVEAAIRAAREMPADFPIGGITVYEHLSSGFWYPWLRRELVRPYYFTDNERLPQYATERVLRARAAELSCIELRLGCTVDDVVDDGARVTVRAASADIGRFELDAEFVVGCDGSHSVVRELAGISTTSVDHERRMVLLLFRSRQLHDLLTRYPGKSFFKVLHPDLDGYWAFFGRVDVGERFFFHCPVEPGADQDTEWASLLARYAGAPIEADIDHVGFWDLRFAHADAYRQGRIFIAGDACHSHPPYGGYGLNVGMEDARNLGWKLAAHLQGWGGDALLDSYQAERWPVFDALGRDFIAASIDDDRRFVRSHHPGRDRADFERAWSRASEQASAAVDEYEPHYEGSPVVVGTRGAVCGAAGTHEVRARAGHHLTPRPLADGRMIDAVLGSGFNLLSFGAADVEVSAITLAAASRGVPLEVIRGPAALAGDYGARMMLTRPDDHVAWCGDRADDPEAIIARVTGTGR